MRSNGLAGAIVACSIRTIEPTTGFHEAGGDRIDAFGRGAFDIALTLAGAAEGMVGREGPHMFSWLRDNPQAKERFSDRKQWIALLNRERDWLKHGGDAQMEIECAPAAFMIARAASKLEAWTPKMEAFRAWLMRHVEEI
ncbi:hypothetical protein AB8Z38_20935 [Bradyrhizobium sp. LLZ17]|uniref:Uncharacterized protein n=1 Tax=Bradyrhizobium sp. LLZ17 TaxID=3239388 RepID=A0AB39XBL8_9BRAD